MTHKTSGERLQADEERGYEHLFEDALRNLQEHRRRRKQRRDLEVYVDDDALEVAVQSEGSADAIADVFAYLERVVRERPEAVPYKVDIRLREVDE